MKIPHITVSQMKKLDNLIMNIGISLEMMMENAGRNLADLAVKLKKDNFVFLIGNGNNGGGGLAAARHLINRGKNVYVIVAEGRNKFKPVPLKQYGIVQNMAKTIIHCNNKNLSRIKELIRKCNIIVDCLLGYGLKGNPNGNICELIILANESKKKILSLDAPSGLDLDNGMTYEPCIRADATMTLALPKKGFLNLRAKKYFGRLYLADISVPKIIYERIGIKTGNLFNKSPVIMIK